MDYVSEFCYRKLDSCNISKSLFVEFYITYYIIFILCYEIKKKQAII